MASVTVTGTADQIRRLAHTIEEAANSSPDQRNVTITIDNGVTNTIASVSTTGDPKGSRHT